MKTTSRRNDKNKLSSVLCAIGFNSLTIIKISSNKWNIQTWENESWDFKTWKEAKEFSENELKKENVKRFI